MADNNPVGSDAGTLTPPDEGALFSDMQGIESKFQPQIEETEKSAESYASKSVAQTEVAADFAERASAEDTAADQELQNWLDHTPTRQASYATSMHAAPVLAIMTALGGKLTRLNGMQMLAATNGIVQGMNEASEAKYNDAMTQWKAAYDKMREHQQRLMDAHRMMMTAYQGRADAYQKASEAARRMTGDLLDDKQHQIAGRVDLFKAQAAAWDKLQRVNIAREHLKVYEAKEISQAKHWKEIEAKSAKADPDTKLQLANEKARWQNAKSQIDEAMKRRGQLNADLTMPEQAKSEALQKVDDQVEALTMEMDRAQSNADALLAGHLAKSAPGATAPLTPKPGAAAATQPDNPRVGVIQRPGSPAQGPSAGGAGADLSPKRMALLEQHKGQPIKWADGTWIMENDGTVHQVQ